MCFINLSFHRIQQSFYELSVVIKIQYPRVVRSMSMYKEEFKTSYSANLHSTYFYCMSVSNNEVGK